MVEGKGSFRWRLYGFDEYLSFCYFYEPVAPLNNYTLCCVEDVRNITEICYPTMQNTLEHTLLLHSRDLRTLWE